MSTGKIRHLKEYNYTIVKSLCFKLFKEILEIDMRLTGPSLQR